MTQEDGSALAILNHISGENMLPRLHAIIHTDEHESTASFSWYPNNNPDVLMKLYLHKDGRQQWSVNLKEIRAEGQTNIHHSGIPESGLSFGSDMILTMEGNEEVHFVQFKDRRGFEMKLYPVLGICRVSYAVDSNKE